MTELTPYAQQLQTRLDSDPSDDIAFEQRYQLLRALFNVVEADLIDRIIEHNETYASQMSTARQMTDATEQQNRIKRIRDTVLHNEIENQLAYDTTLQRLALELLSRRTDLRINSDATFLGEFLVNSWKDSQTAPRELAEYGSTPTMDIPIASLQPSEVKAGRLVESISGSHRATPIIEEVMEAFPDLEELIEQEYSQRLRQREAAAEATVEATVEAGELKPPIIKLH